MKSKLYFVFWSAIIIVHMGLYGQSSENCFLENFELRRARIPDSVPGEKPAEAASVTVTVTTDTLGKISKYVFGNAIAAWAGNGYTDPTLVDNTKLLSPTLIRFPGGSWGDIYFWDELPSDIPDSLFDGMTYNGSTASENYVYWQSGEGTWVTTPEQYYTYLYEVDTDGLITVNYGYARYGLSEDPVAKAAHLAAEWVRYDDGVTKFWEIGNENAGPWEAGWMIDTVKNKDGQPQLITGELYGKHFKVFVDSMKAAAEEIGVTIYIGGQLMHFDASTSWNSVERNWNEGFLREVGDKADFYVMHNYFSTSTDIKSILNFASSEPKKNIDFIRQDIIDKNAYSKPIAITEYNIGEGSLERAVSYVNGMQSVILVCEMIKNNYSLAARWLLVTGEGAMFYDGPDDDFKYHPRPDFYYLTYLQKFYGDHAISATSSFGDILCYASQFSSGETGVIIVNKNTTEKIVKIDLRTIGVGTNYYLYSFTAGQDNSKFSRYVLINGYGPSEYHWGPYDDLSDLPAESYVIDNEIKITSPGRSVQMILIEGGDNYITSSTESDEKIPDSYLLFQNYPNPFNPSTIIEYQLPEYAHVTLKIFDILGREVRTIVNEYQNAGKNSVVFNASDLSGGVYFYKIETGKFSDTKKLLLIK